MDAWLSFSALFFLLGTITVFIMRLTDHSERNRKPLVPDGSLAPDDRSKSESDER